MFSSNGDWQEQAAVSGIKYGDLPVSFHLEETKTITMVCKKEVIAWFCDLTASRRIDFLCALMDCCSPLELRFLGTYVESLGRRDYDRLRESELHANDVSYLSKLTNITDIRILDKVLTSLALMNSRCTNGATVLYRTLKEHTDAILSNGFRTRHHTETDEKVVLLAVIAVNHPAFTFSQKQALRSQLYALLQAVESKVVPEVIVYNIHIFSGSIFRPTRVGRGVHLNSF